MKKQICTLIFFICITTLGSMQAQVKYSFISLQEKYEFNFPQFDLSIPLPAKAGFKAPSVEDAKIMFEIDTETIYCFDVERLETDKNAGKFIFSIPGCEADYLYMSMSKMPVAEFYTRKRVWTEHTSYEQLPVIKMRLGKETYSISDVKYDYHYFHHEGYLFCMRLSSKTPQKIKKQYLNIIRNIQSKDLRLSRTKYENRIKYGYFDRKNDNSEEDKERYKFLNWEGKTDSQTTFVWDLFNFQIAIPSGWKYNVNAEQILKANDDKTVHAVMDSLDLYHNSMMMSWFTSDSLSFSLRSYTKESSVNLEDMIKRMASMANYTVTKLVDIDGISVPATLYGTNEIATIDTYYEVNGIKHWLSFSGITSKTLPLADKMLSSIKIDQPQIKGKKQTNSSGSFSDCFKMEESTPIVLDAPLNVPYLDEDNIIECNLPNIGMKLGILGPENQWYCSVGIEKVEMKDGIVKAVPLNNTDKRLTIYSMQPEGVYYNISKVDEPKDMKTYTENFKRSYKGYKNISVMHASVVTINNNEWSIFIYKQGDSYTGMFTTVYPGYEMAVAATGTSYDEIVKKSGYIRLIQF